MVDQKGPQPNDLIEMATRWGLVTLAVLAAFGALLRVLGPGTPTIAEGLDQTTLLYLGVAGAMLVLRQVKTFSLGQLKLEMIEKLRERQQRQEEKIADIALILPLLLRDQEVSHIRNLFMHRTDAYHGCGSLREELRRLRYIGLIAKKPNHNIGDMRDGTVFDLAHKVELTDLGRRWAFRIQEIHSGDAKPVADPQQKTAV
jgi:hypothetical protein